VKFIASLASSLAVLTAALDEPEFDIGQGLYRLAAVVAAAVPSYLGLRVVVTRHDPVFTLTLLHDDRVTLGDVGTSITLALPCAGDRDVPAVTFILYASSPGAFVDLAADLASLTGDPPQNFPLDAHLEVPAEPDVGAELSAASVINQAIGVLIGRGSTPQQAHAELTTQAAVTRTDRLTVAHLILARLAADHA
jgi:hypothetical protein